MRVDRKRSRAYKLVRAFCLARKDPRNGAASTREDRAAGAAG